MALLQKKWPYWSALVSIVKIHVKFEWEKYYRELSYLGSSMFRGPVWARSMVQKWVLPTLGDLPTELGYFKIVCRGLKKLLGGRPNIGLLWSRLPWAKTPIFCGSALKFWQHWHKSWSNHYWQHGFSIRDVITGLFTNHQFFYHLNSTSSWQPKCEDI